MKLPFDKIYCLHLADDTERYEQCICEFKRIGILDQVEFWWTCKRNISNEVGLTIPTLIDQTYEDWLSKNLISRKELAGNVFNCAFEHYTIVKTSYQRGFNHILIIEDDIRFIDNLKLIEDTFSNLPEDYDILKLHDSEGSAYEDWYWDGPSDKQVFRKENNFAHSTLCYALSNKGMYAYYRLLDYRFTAADQINVSTLSENGAINVYTIRYRIVLDGNNKSRINMNEIDIKK